DIAKRFPYLITPFFPEMLFLAEKNRATRAHVLDVHNMLVKCRDTPEWKALDQQGVRIVTWANDDPLEDTFRRAPTGLDCSKSRAVILVCANRLDVQDGLLQSCDTFNASVRSYSAWVPMNFTKAICRRK